MTMIGSLLLLIHGGCRSLGTSSLRTPGYWTSKRSWIVLGSAVSGWYHTKEGLWIHLLIELSALLETLIHLRIDTLLLHHRSSLLCKEGASIGTEALRSTHHITLLLLEELKG